MKYMLREDATDIALTQAQHDALITAKLIYDSGHGDCRIAHAHMEACKQDVDSAVHYVEGFLAGKGLPYPVEPADASLKRYRVRKGVDAQLFYVAYVEATSREDAGWQAKEGDYEWIPDGDTVFDSFDVVDVVEAQPGDEPTPAPDKCPTCGAEHTE